MTDAPPLNGQHIGEAEHAIRAVLDHLLADANTTFHQWVAFRVLDAGGGRIARDVLVQRMMAGLKVDEAPVVAAIDELDTLDLVTGTDEIAVTPAGRARFQTIQDGVDRVAERLYADLPVDDLATTRRVLAVVTERANAVLAG